MKYLRADKIQKVKKFFTFVDIFSLFEHFLLIEKNAIKISNIIMENSYIPHNL